MEARRSSGSTVGEVPSELELEDLDETRVYGSRLVEVEDADGTTRFEEVPLTWNDLFDPQEGDRFMHSPDHSKILRRTGSILDCLYDARGRDDVVVYDDVRFDWKTPGVKPACPDVAVIPGMKKLEKGKRRPVSFNEKKEGTSPCFVLEVTSKSTAKYDRTSKPAIYRQAGVPEIFLVDDLKSPWELSGERWDPKIGTHVELRPGRRGRLLAETLGVYFSISASGDDLVLEDAASGELLLKPVEESRARRAAERQAAEEAEARRKEAEAREAAEQQAAEEAEARRKEVEAREAAERQAAGEAEARQAAEKRVELGLRRGIKDLCAVLGLVWNAERSAQVERMTGPRLETLRAHIVHEKSWPESFSDLPL